MIEPAPLSGVTDTLVITVSRAVVLLGAWLGGAFDNDDKEL